jgi:exodeoxyribonuclease VII large subunit
MTRRIDIEPTTERLRIEFSYDEQLVSTVKTLPQRTWDPGERAWFVPFEHIERVFDVLLEKHFKISPSLREFCDQRDRPVDEIIDGGDQPSGRTGPVPPGTKRISEVNLEAKAALEGAFPDSFWVVGELQGYDPSPNRGYAFFELVERPAPDEDPVAKVGAVMWADAMEAVEATIQDAAADIRLRDGLSVRFRVEMDLYPPHGAYRLVVKEIDPTYTSGEIQQNRQAIIDRLDKEGILTSNLDRPWPICPLRVALLTSEGSDAYSDFMDELKRSGYGFEVSVFDIFVQGDRTEQSMLTAIERVRERIDQFDVLVVVRGGGARSDLAYFDTDAIGEALCELPLKGLCGIGHQKDVCLLDHVLESSKTPTAAAQALVERVRTFEERLDETLTEITQRARDRVQRAGDRLNRVSAEVRHRAERRLAGAQRRLSTVRASLSMAASRRLGEARRRVDNAAERLPRVAERRVDRARRQVDQSRRRIGLRRIERMLARERENVDGLAESLKRSLERRIRHRRQGLDQLAERLSLLDPQRVLERGFAIVRHDGEVLRRADLAASGDSLDIRVADGELTARVESRDDDSDDTDEET